MNKYLNLLILFVLLGFGVLFKNQLHLSTNLLSLFATQESIDKFKIASDLGYSKELLITVKGFDSKAKKQVREIAKKLKDIKHIRYVRWSVIPSAKIQEYYKRYYPIVADFHPVAIEKKNIEQKLQSLYEAQLSSAFYTTIDKYDPLGMFHLDIVKNVTPKRGDLIALGTYGYLIRAMTDITPSNINESKELYEDIQKLLSGYPDAVAFAPFFYTVENSAAFKADVQWIAALSTFVLFLLYAVLIRNLRLLFQTLLALANSMLFATLICMLFIENFNVLSLAFGMSLSAVSIDYLFHYYFHNFYQSRRKIDKDVFFGYVTTAAAFAVFSFVPVPLVSQISIFAFLSLSFAYVVFTFIFPKLSIEPYKAKLSRKKESSRLLQLPSTAVFALSLLLLFYSLMHFRLDTDVKNLDYQNKHLKSIEQIFKTHTNGSLKPIVVEASSQNELLERLHRLHRLLPDSLSFASFVKEKRMCEARKKELQTYDFATIKRYIKEAAVKTGFKEHYFDDSYDFVSKLPSCDDIDLDIFKSYGLSLYRDYNRYYTIALVSNVQKAKQLPFVTALDAKEIFNQSTRYMYESIVKYSLAVLLLILVLLVVSVKERFIYALNYILFPIALTMTVLVSMGSVNIMHIFSLIILVAIGIDYGIYMSNSDKKEQTMLAIKYSLLSTFSAFGVLIFSSITALHSIGLVITLGCIAIFILIITPPTNYLKHQEKKKE